MADWTDCPWCGQHSPPPLPKPRPEMRKAYEEALKLYDKTSKESMEAFANRFNKACEGMYLNQERFEIFMPEFSHSCWCQGKLAVNDESNYSKLLEVSNIGLLAEALWSNHTYKFEDCQFVYCGRDNVEFKTFSEELVAIVIMAEMCKEVGWNG